MPGPSRSPAIPVIEALQLIEEAAASIETGQGGSDQVRIIMASLATIWDAVERNAGVRAAAIDTFEIARALVGADAPSDRVRLRRLLRQALGKLHDRVGVPSLTAKAPHGPCESERAEAA
jgi:hypothetical protein